MKTRWILGRTLSTSFSHTSTLTGISSICRRSFCNELVRHARDSGGQALSNKCSMEHFVDVLQIVFSSCLNFPGHEDSPDQNKENTHAANSVRLMHRTSLFSSPDHRRSASRKRRLSRRQPTDLKNVVIFRHPRM